MKPALECLLFCAWSAWVFWLGRQTVGVLPTEEDFAVHLPPPPEGLGEFAWKRNGELPQP